MSNRKTLVKTINGIKTKYENDLFKIVKDYEWNEYIVIDKSLPKFDSDGIEYGYFTDCIDDAIDTFNGMTNRAQFAHAFCHHMNTAEFK